MRAGSEGEERYSAETNPEGGGGQAPPKARHWLYPEGKTGPGAQQEHIGKKMCW